MIRIAIDGPGGAGKSTIAKAVAKELGIDYIDTGAMYRAVGYKMKKEGISVDDEKRVGAMLEHTEIDFSGGDTLLDGTVVNEEIRTPEIAAAASACAALPAVRSKLVDLQRRMAQTKSVIMDGRDIGTNVLTDAEFKFYMTASAEERAKRRFDELIAKGDSVRYEDVLKDIEERDRNDMTRKLNPLRKAEDAIELDTTSMSISEVTDRIVSEIKRG
ncbi:MAG: (d)CMP kinase [Eubacteriaceae bacterium]|jgi:cytidylate kinase|nr:(d)CMP kinase [Eubacteriaceae bacterium]